MDVASYEHAVQNRSKHTLKNGTNYWKNVYIQSMDNMDDPQCYLIEQEPNSEVLPHFHSVDQFQVIVKGSGMLGKHPVQPVSIHYADGYKPYGPIHSSEQGLYYITLRNATDSGAKFMPESREQLKKGSRKAFFKDNLELLNVTKLKEWPDPVIETLFSSPDTGLAAYKLTIGPNQKTACPSPQDSGGQYILVAQGSIIVDTESYSCWSCVYLHPHEQFTLLSGGEGAEVLILQYPKK